MSKSVLQTIHGEVVYIENNIFKYEDIKENLDKEIWLSKQSKDVQKEWINTFAKQNEFEDVTDCFIGILYLSYFDVLECIKPNFSFNVSLFKGEDEVGVLDFQQNKKREFFVDDYIADNKEVREILDKMLDSCKVGKTYSMFKLENYLENLELKDYEIEAETNVFV